jgi:cytochrome c oxidase assembly protein subunit 15
MLGVVFAVGFVYFLVRQYFDKKMIKPFVVLFLLGGLQGLIGWIMVASGLNDSHLYVDHIKLALHFVSAMVLACYTLWFALQLLIPEHKRVTNTGFRKYTLMIILLLFVQLTYGAFMAGLKAAMAAPTWPSINGMTLPGNLTTGSWMSDKMNVHFFHRTIAYLLLFLLVFWYAKAKKISKSFKDAALIQTARWPVIFVLVQVALGIATVLCAPLTVPGKFGVFEILAELHQLTAMFLLMAVMVNLYVVKNKVRG